MTVSLYGYQKRDVILMEDCDGHILNASEMGTGKTIETLAAIKRNPEWWPVLIVSQANMKYQWRVEAGRLGLQASVCEGQRPPVYNRHDFTVISPITICNYDILKHWLPYLLKIGIKTVVCDECQNIMNPTTMRSKATAKVVKSAKRAMMLSGTPFLNRVYEFWHALHLLWPHEFMSFDEFTNEYCVRRWTPFGYDYSKSQNLDKLNAKLNRLGMIRNRMSDVLPDLPERTRNIIPIELSDAREYKLATDDFMTWLTKTMPHRVRSARRAEALAKVGYLLRLAARLKFQGVLEWVNGFLENRPDQKLVLFAIHDQAIGVLQRRVKAKYVTLDGGTSNEQKHLVVQQFQQDPETRVFIGSRSAWSGVTLTAASNLCFTEFWWRPGDIVQGEARIRRIGQQFPSFIHFFYAVGTIEERLCKILQDKQGDISAVLDGGQTNEDLNLFDILVKELEREAK